MPWAYLIGCGRSWKNHIRFAISICFQFYRIGGGFSSGISVRVQEIKPKAQADWLGFCKGVRIYVQVPYYETIKERESGRLNMNKFHFHIEL